MRVAVVSLRTPEDDDTAAARRTARTARLLADRGHDVTVFCSRWWDGHEHERTEGDVRYVAITEDPVAPWLFALALPLMLLQFDPDAIHVAHDPPEQVLGAKLGGLLARAPVVVDWYGDPKHPGSEATRRLSVRWPEKVIVPSRLVGTWVRELGADDDAVSVVPESVDMSLVKNAPVEGDADVVYARRLDEDANVESLLLALAELRERDWQALIVGDGPERDRYEQQAADLRIDDRVEFAGDLPQMIRLGRYRSAQVFVQTATKECFATELLWAMAAGCVGVVEYQADSSAHELIEHRERGIRTTNDVELSEAIVEASQRPDLDVDESLADYDQDVVVGEFVECYREAQESFGLF
ncbi:glycosyl transferase family 1 [Halobacteriales archaeon QS_1_68_20]|nr:MAG: glycosyl transferase family 1 [Halobacteriales archaeon QS_1_68_20]